MLEEKCDNCLDELLEARKLAETEEQRELLNEAYGLVEYVKKTNE